MHVAIIGSGISGLSAAYALRGLHAIRLFEGDSRPGGHVKTVTVDDRERPARRRHRVHRLQRGHLPATQRPLRGAGRRDPADGDVARPPLSCAATSSSARSGRGGMFAQPDALARPSHWRMIADLRRFYAIARGRLDAGTADRTTLGAFLEDGGLRRRLPRPLPRADRLRGLVHRGAGDHGLPGRLPAAPSWTTTVSSASATASPGGRSWAARWSTSSASSSVCRKARSVPGTPWSRCGAMHGGVRVTTQSGARERFDAVIMATHADDALALLADADSGGAGGVGQLRLHHQRGGPAHRRAAAAPPRAGARLVERRYGGLPAARRAADHDLPT